MDKPFINIVSTHSGDDNVDPAYSKEENAYGVNFAGTTRYMLSTRNDGSILIDATSNGNATINCYNFPDNIE